MARWKVGDARLVATRCHHTDIALTAPAPAPRTERRSIMGKPTCLFEPRIFPTSRAHCKFAQSSFFTCWFFKSKATISLDLDLPSDQQRKCTSRVELQPTQVDADLDSSSCARLLSAQVAGAPS